MKTQLEQIEEYFKKSTLSISMWVSADIQCPENYFLIMVKKLNKNFIKSLVFISAYLKDQKQGSITFWDFLSLLLEVPLWSTLNKSNLSESNFSINAYEKMSS